MPKPQNEFCIWPGNPQISGVYRLGDTYNFTLEAQEDDEISLLLYKKGSKSPSYVIPMEESFRTGRVFSVRIAPFPETVEAYNYEINGKVCQDPCAGLFLGKGAFGSEPAQNPHKVRCGFLADEPYDWEGSDLSSVLFEEMVLYKIHVRGYTRQRTQLGSLKGTFAGLMEMIPYWKDLGITAVEFMPAYEFCEREKTPEPDGLVNVRRQEARLNYWGYGRGCYFAPKSAYCATKDPEREVQDLIRAMHKAGIAVIMEFYFPADVNPYTVLNALHFWKLHYHVDGFHLTGDGVPAAMVKKDAILSDTLLMASGQGGCGGAPRRSRVHGIARRVCAEYNSGFMEDMRRFLKSDEGMVDAAKHRLCRLERDHAVINYMACQDGFTLYDLVSYNYKHNEANGEENRDGSDFNYSWNCGVEGPSRKAAVRSMRRVQVRNAFALVLLAREVPMIYAGDEIGNSQKGNNNAYCQDNPVGWTDWKGEQTNAELLSFVKKLIAFRREHPVLRLDEDEQQTFRGRGVPALSFHGERAWVCTGEHTCRLLGIMYAGLSPKKEAPEDYLYIACNFHWEERTLALPDLKDGFKWEKVIDTGDLKGDGFVAGGEFLCEKNLEMQPRTIVVLQGVPGAPEKAGKETEKAVKETEKAGKETEKSPKAGRKKA